MRVLPLVFLLIFLSGCGASQSETPAPIVNAEATAVVMRAEQEEKDREAQRKRDQEQFEREQRAEQERERLEIQFKEIGNTILLSVAALAGLMVAFGLGAAVWNIAAFIKLQATMVHARNGIFPGMLVRRGSETHYIHPQVSTSPVMTLTHSSTREEILALAGKRDSKPTIHSQLPPDNVGLQRLAIQAAGMTTVTAASTGDVEGRGRVEHGVDRLLAKRMAAQMGAGGSKVDVDEEAPVEGEVRLLRAPKTFNISDDTGVRELSDGTEDRQVQLLNLSEKIEDALERVYPTKDPSGKRVYPFDCNGVTSFPLAGIAQFILSPSRHTKCGLDHIVNRRADIAREVGTTAVRVYQNTTGAYVIEVQMFNPPSPTIEQLLEMTRKEHRLKIPVGRMLSGLPKIWDLNNPGQPHILIAGMSGGGKTALAHSILITACKRNTPKELRVVVIDPHNRSPKWLMNHISEHALPRQPETMEEVTEALRQIAVNMQRIPLPIIVYVDELSAVCQSKDALKAVEQIAREGRKFGVHLMLCTQRPSVAEIGPSIKSNTTRIVGKMASPEDSKVASGVAGVGAENLPEGQGVFVFVDSERSRFQGALPDGFGEVEYSGDGTLDIFDQPFQAPNITSQRKVGITLASVVEAMAQLTDQQRAINRTAVLALLGYSNAGGNTTKINSIWDEAQRQYQNSLSAPTTVDGSGSTGAS